MRRLLTAGAYVDRSSGKVEPRVVAMLEGKPGDPGEPGVQGPRGWTAMYRAAADGTRSLFEIYNWWGGEGEKPATGYLTEAGPLSSTKAGGFNFNRSKRIESYSAQTRTTSGSETGTALSIGEKKIVFTSEFPSVPRVVPTARANVGGRPVVAEVVTVTTTYCVVRASQSKGTLASLLSAVFDLVGGVTIDCLVIEA